MSRPHRELRLRRLAVRSAVVGAVGSLSVVLAACGSDGVALARTACNDVNHSIALYEASFHAPTRAVAIADQQRAYVELRAALPPAAQATSQNGNWNALMTTISESARVGEGSLIHALMDQCQVADGNNPDVPPQPTPGGPGAPGTGGTIGTLPGGSGSGSGGGGGNGGSGGTVGTLPN